MNMPSFALSAAFVLCGCECINVVQDFPFEDTVVVANTNDTITAFAVKEFNDIVSKSTGRRFDVSECRCGSNASRIIYVGRCADTVAKFGADFVDSLKNEESVVVAKGRDLYLFGGGQLGTLYAVYDFVEDNLGYRWYFNRPDGEVIDRCAVVRFKGVGTRKRPAFKGYRKDHHDNRDEALFETRNRGNAIKAEWTVPGYTNGLCPRIPGHGFNPFLLPPYDTGDAGWGEWFRKLGIKGEFKEHPEWFSLDKSGKRVDDAQICLSNTGCREKLLQNLIKWIEARGAGVYMVGSNDNHNDRYCWCDKCLALEKKYASVGGPLWDWIIWAGPELKKRGYGEAIISSLAYKGWRQTEIAPKGIERFPDNFNCDAGFLNFDRELSCASFDTRLPDGSTYNRLENLRRWCEICSHVSYWYYGCCNPAQNYIRMQNELKELCSAGVESVGACGTGGGFEFGDMTSWMFFRLLRDPDCDLEPDLKRMFSIKYGPAAEDVRMYLDVLQKTQRAAIKTLPATCGSEQMYDGFSYLTGRNLLDMREIMDRALAKARGSEYELPVMCARAGLNIWTIMFFHKIKDEDPSTAAKIDCKALDAESRLAWERSRKPKLIASSVPQSLDQMVNYMNLKDDSLPAELAKYPKDKVFRILPPKSAPYFCGVRVVGLTSEADPKAASGWAWRDKIPENISFAEKKSVPVEVYDAGLREWLLHSNQAPIPLSVFRKGKYSLCRIGKMRITSRFNMIFAGLWGHPTNITQPARLFDPTYVNKEWEIWASIKGEGPKFFPDVVAGDSYLSIDQVFCVDCGVPIGK